MKKRVLVLVAIMAIAVSSLAAVDVSLAIGGRGTFGEMKINNSVSYDFSIDGEVDLDFDRGHGMLIGLVLTKSDIDLSVGYAYQTDISSNCDFILGAGAIFGLNPALGLDFFVTADFDFIITDGMFIRIGTGFITDLGQIGDGYGKDPKFIIPLPAIGFGLDF